MWLIFGEVGLLQTSKFQLKILESNLKFSLKEFTNILISLKNGRIFDNIVYHNIKFVFVFQQQLWQDKHYNYINLVKFKVSKISITFMSFLHFIKWVKIP